MCDIFALELVISRAGCVEGLPTGIEGAEKHVDLKPWRATVS